MPVLLTLAIVAGVFVYIHRVSATPAALSDVTRDGDDVVVTVHAPAWLASRRRLTAPVTSVSNVSVVPPGTRLRLRLRLWGTGWPGMSLGWFWGNGVCFVIRRRRREAVEISFAAGRVRRWIVETTVPADVVSSLVPGDTRRA